MNTDEVDLRSSVSFRGFRRFSTQNDEFPAYFVAAGGLTVQKAGSLAMTPGPG